MTATGGRVSCSCTGLVCQEASRAAKRAEIIPKSRSSMDRIPAWQLYVDGGCWPLQRSLTYTLRDTLAGLSGSACAPHSSRLASDPNPIDDEIPSFLIPFSSVSFSVASSSLHLTHTCLCNSLLCDRRASTWLSISLYLTIRCDEGCLSTSASCNAYDRLHAEHSTGGIAHDIDLMLSLIHI